MADTKISAMTDGVTANATDRFPMVRDPGGTPTNVYGTPDYIRSYLLALANSWSGIQTFANGLVGAPSIRFANDADTGFWSVAAGSISVSTDGTEKFRFGAFFNTLFGMSFGSLGTPEAWLQPDGAGFLGLRNIPGTTALAFRQYDTYTSATDYHRSVMGSARATLSGVTGASVTASGLIPDGALLLGVTTKVTTALGVTNGTTGYTVGDGSDVDRWGDITGTASGTSSDNTNATVATAIGAGFIAAQDVVLTAKTGNFDGTGVIRVTAFFLKAECD
jgi:hypothetical protein